MWKYLNISIADIEIKIPGKIKIQNSTQLQRYLNISTYSDFPTKMNNCVASICK